jgi:myo-inositol-1-phosphate synthase
VNKPESIAPPSGKLGILMPGMGAVATTVIAGVEAIKAGIGQPIGSLTQMGTIRLGKRTEGRSPLIADFVPLADLDSLVFGGWDVFPDDAYDSATHAGVLHKDLLDQIRDQLKTVKPMPAVFDRNYVRRLEGSNVKSAKSKWDAVLEVRDDIQRFKAENGVERLVMIWCGSTEIFMEHHQVHNTIEGLEKAIRENHEAIPPSMIYAYAALQEGVPFLNGAPNLTVDVPAMVELAKQKGVPIGGKDFKTGQTLMKTLLAPGLKARMIGNRDGEVLDDPDSFKTKEVSKLDVLEFILQPELYPELYGDIYHKVRINYYPPRGDEKEGWDNIDIFGWLGMPMQIKVDFLCRDSILAAPLVLDLVLFTDLAQRAGMSGIQEWLSFYFKSPMTAPELYPEHDLFIQLMKLKNTLRYLQGEELITHLGQEYYD